MSQPATKLKVAALASGRGTNLQALLDAASQDDALFTVVLTISDNPDSHALERAKNAGVATALVERKNFSSRKLFDNALADVVEKSGAGLVCLAGFMRVLSPAFLSRLQGRVINIHPSLLPAFPGLNAQQQALDYGVKVTGCTTHFVDEGVDTGPIIMQATAPLEPDDTVETLSQRILAKEHVIYVKTVELIAKGDIGFPHSGAGRKTI